MVKKSKINALIVESDHILQKLLTTSVKKRGFNIHCCNDAESGWEYFCKAKPLLIILEWDLPKMSGIALCRKMRASTIGRYITILMISNRENPQELEDALNAGVNYYKVKPVRDKFLEAWLSMADKNVHDMISHKTNNSKIEEYKQELEIMNDQLEESISCANKMAMEAETAYLEINQIFKTIAGGILLIDKEYNIIRHNETFLEMAGVTNKEAATLKCYKVFHAGLYNTDDCPLRKIQHGMERIENQVSDKQENGKIVHYNLISTCFRGLGGELIGIVTHISDITKRVKAEEALKESKRKYKELSIIDELTNLFNKRHFNKTLQFEIDRARRYQYQLSLLIMDIDNFKHYNDTYGHAEGDKVLARLGEIITNSIRTNDLASRYGGEEFTVILPATIAKDGIVVAERIRIALLTEDFYPLPDEKVNKTISIGITQYIAGDDKESLIKRADANLYRAKRQGKNRYALDEITRSLNDENLKNREPLSEI